MQAHKASYSANEMSFRHNENEKRLIVDRTATKQFK